jgi:hypothetical protein
MTPVSAGRNTAANFSEMCFVLQAAVY